MKTKQTQFSSQGSVYRPTRHGTGIWGNPRVPMTVRVDAKLKKRAKQYLIRKFGSTCRGVESIFAALLKAEDVEKQSTVYRLPTTKINFEKVVIERNIKTRRKMIVDEEVEEKVKVSKVCCTFCHRDAERKLLYKKKDVVRLCLEHYNLFRRSPNYEATTLEVGEVG